jgi:hypothetical protein
MSDEIQDDTHDKLVNAFIDYSKANTKFEAQGFMAQAMNARQALVEIGKLVKIRRKEIFEKRVAIHGHKEKGIEPTAPSKSRQKKLDKQRQKAKEQAQGSDT